jgi:hypothetical protein
MEPLLHAAGLEEWFCVSIFIFSNLARISFSV